MNETHLDIFSGIGGFALAAQWAGFRTVGFCESDSRCREFLGKRWGLPVHPDIRKLDATVYRGISLLTGGPPCQPASRAGKQGGTGDNRWLWPEALRVLDEAKPDSVVFENPPGILDVGIDGILSEMGRLGYEVQCFDIPACAVDSPQLRHRIWIVGFLVGKSDQARRSKREQRAEAARHWHSIESAISGSLADDSSQRRGSGRTDTERGSKRRDADKRDCADKLADSSGQRQPQPRTSGSRSLSDSSSENGKAVQSFDDNASCLVADTKRERRERGSSEFREAEGRQSFSSAPGLHWQNAVWVPCADGKLRRAPDDSQCLADGIPVELLAELAEEIAPIYEEGSTATHYQPHRSILAALGNSIVPQVAYEILRAVKAVLT